MFWEVGGVTWEIAPNAYTGEDGRDVIHRYCDGIAKVWNAVEMSVYEYMPTDRVVVIVCNVGYLTFIDIYRKQRHWEVLRRQIISCNDLPYVIPVVKRVLTRERFGNVTDVVNYIVERWIKLIRYLAQL